MVLHDIAPHKSQAMPRSHAHISREKKAWDNRREQLIKKSGGGGKQFFLVKNCWLLLLTVPRGCSPQHFSEAVIFYSGLLIIARERKATSCSVGLWCNYQQVDYIYFLSSGTYLFLWQYSVFFFPYCPQAHESTHGISNTRSNEDYHFTRESVILTAEY